MLMVTDWVCKINTSKRNVEIQITAHQTIVNIATCLLLSDLQSFQGDLEASIDL